MCPFDKGHKGKFEVTYALLVDYWSNPLLFAGDNSSTCITSVSSFGHYRPGLHRRPRHAVSKRRRHGPNCIAQRYISKVSYVPSILCLHLY
jgi:hypothetical protein